MKVRDAVDEFFDGRTIGYARWRGGNGWVWRESGYDDWDDVTTAEIRQLFNLLRQILPDEED